LKVSDLVKRKPVVVSKDATIKDAARLMASEGVGLLVVVDLSNPTKPVGVVSERDVIRAIAKGISLDEKLNTIATKKLITVELDEDIGKAAAKMASNKIRHLVVLDKSGKLAGVLSIRDLVAEKSTLQAIVSSYETEPLPGGD
jgi:Predicted signal-transduction protein containing cAMP-binding and CBS domains